MQTSMQLIKTVFTVQSKCILELIYNSWSQYLDKTQLFKIDCSIKIYIRYVCLVCESMAEVMNWLRSSDVVMETLFNYFVVNKLTTVNFNFFVVQLVINDLCGSLLKVGNICRENFMCKFINQFEYCFDFEGNIWILSDWITEPFWYDLVTNI